jgi:hypothetical protein
MFELKYIIFFFVLFIGVPIGVIFAKRFIYIEKFFWFLLLFFTARTEDINFISMETYRGTSRGFEIGLVDITAIILFFLIYSRKDKYPITLPPASYIYFLYFTFSFFSIMNSDVYVYSFFELWKMVRMYFYFFVVYNLVRSFDDIEDFLKYMVIIVGFITIIVLKQKYLEGMFQTKGPFPHQNSLVMYMIVYGSVFLSYLLNVKDAKIYVWIIAFGAASVDIISTLSRGGMAVFSISIFIIFVLSYRHKFTMKKLGITLVFFICATGILYKASDTIMERIKTAPEESLDVRVVLAEAAQNMANDKVFGIGLNNFGLKINPPYHYGDHIQRKDDDEKGGIVETVYLLIAAETGWANLFVFISFLMFFYFKNIKNYMALKKGKLKKYRYIPMAFIGCLTSMYLQSTMEWVLKQTNNFYQLMFIFAIIAVVSRLIKKGVKNEKSK